MVSLARSSEALIFARFVSGLAIGGLLAAIWSLNIEAMSIVMFGFSFGGFVAGPVTNWLAPDHGWHWVYFFCGALTFVVALILLVTLPESARWMVAKGADPERIRPMLRRFDPALDSPFALHQALESRTRRERARTGSSPHGLTGQRCP